ncbi:unnamed protein product [Caenorhabditis bovis]|uniref:Uncharacterized protein n=1 Tax=Caenorhabditis bovis TaxID=2654633 RepID=A0A8S1F858_9PELO|nr:unnamed protein product [Caenorhabditis bovis]
MNSLLLLFVFPILASAGHDTDWHFIKWMEKHLKPNEVKEILRNELRTGSFGGGPYSGDVRPVILVHGLNNEAGNFWKIRADFVGNGFPKNRIFATTWGKGLRQIDFDVKMSCNYVQHIRKFIETVIQYTGAPQVDIIAYSMGSPIARKAILGGPCVDRPSTNIGARITDRIHTFISVAGANQGSHLCILPFFGICNLNTGLTCNSNFLKNINGHKKYEASYKIHNIASTADMIVGYFACGTRASYFAGAIEHKLDGLNHEQVEYNTAKLQLSLLREEGGVSTKIPPNSREIAKKNPSSKSDPFNDVRRYLRMPRRRRH